MIATPTPHGAPVLDLEHVEKTYRKGKVRALREARLTIGHGEVFGLLGPNGAGKSTLVKVLMTVVHPSVCRGTMLGAPVGTKHVLSRVGYLPEHHRFPDYLKGRQVMHTMGAMSGVSKRDRKKRAEELLELVGMSDWANKRVGSYSKGMRQRLGIAQSLINDPQLVLLDEPADGVDPVGRREIRDLIGELKRRDVTVFLNSHLLSELEMVCDRVAIMVKGRIVQQGTIDELTIDEQRVEITVDSADGAGRLEAALREASTDRVERERETVRVYGVSIDDAQRALDTARSMGLRVHRFLESRPSLEDLFMSAVEEDASVGAISNEEDAS